MNPLLPGVAMLSKKAGALVLPVGIAGTQKGAKGKVKVAYGKPFAYEDVAKGSTEREARAAFRLELERRILDLCKEAGLTLESGSIDEIAEGVAAANQ